MKLAGTLDLDEVLRGLALERPIFHSEADFQLALAWHVQQCDPAMRVRLERRLAPGQYVDVECARPDRGTVTFVELKFRTRRWSGDVKGERYDLKDQGAGDFTGYDVVKDIWRVERFVDDRAGSDGVVIMLTNDAYYWKRPQSDDATNAAAFRLGEGVLLAGRRAWGLNTGRGTMKDRESPLYLRGQYVLRWHDYSVLPGGGSAATVRQLVIPVGQ